jgi:hypothetical protein
VRKQILVPGVGDCPKNNNCIITGIWLNRQFFSNRFYFFHEKTKWFFFSSSLCCLSWEQWEKYTTTRINSRTWETFQMQTWIGFVKKMNIRICQKKGEPFLLIHFTYTHSHISSQSHSGMMIKGWEIGIQTMKTGEKSILFVRSDYGYGKEGRSRLSCLTSRTFCREFIISSSSFESLFLLSRFLSAHIYVSLSVLQTFLQMRTSNLRLNCSLLKRLHYILFKIQTIKWIEY